MEWEEWCQRYPAKVVDQAPVNFEAFFESQARAESHKDYCEVRDEMAYEVVAWNGRFWVVKK